MNDPDQFHFLDEALDEFIQSKKDEILYERAEKYNPIYNNKYRNEEEELLFDENKSKAILLDEKLRNEQVVEQINSQLEAQDLIEEIEQMTLTENREEMIQCQEYLKEVKKVVCMFCVCFYICML